MYFTTGLHINGSSGWSTYNVLTVNDSDGILPGIYGIRDLVEKKVVYELNPPEYA